MSATKERFNITVYDHVCFYYYFFSLKYNDTYLLLQLSWADLTHAEFTKYLNANSLIDLNKNYLESKNLLRKSYILSNVKAYLEKCRQYVKSKLILHLVFIFFCLRTRDHTQLSTNYFSPITFLKRRIGMNPE